MNKKSCSCLAWLVISLSFLALPVQATTIRYEATNLADVNAGEDLWRYRYQVSDQSFLADFGFDIFFDVADGYVFGDLRVPTTSNPDWDVVSIQPDPALPHDGFSMRSLWSITQASRTLSLSISSGAASVRRPAGVLKSSTIILT